MADLFLVPKPDTAHTDESLPPDWEARRQALDVRGSWIVEAPAGSGKTGLLIQRFLKLLADESVEQPEQVLAITFTVKATTEMRDRIVTQLQRATGPDSSKSEFDRETRALAQAVRQRDEQLGWELLHHPHRLNVRTIDSVCGEIARSLPVLSGGGGRLSPIEDATLLYREAARQTLMQLGGPDAALNEALHTLLLHRDGNLADCEQLLAEILALRNQWGEFVPLTGAELDEAHLDRTVRPRLQRILEQAVCAGLSQLAASIPADVLDDLSALAGEMGHADGYKGGPSPIAPCAGIHTAPDETAEQLERWRALIHLLTTKEGKWRATAARNHLGFEIEKHHAQRLQLLVDQLRDRDDLLLNIRRVSKLPPAKYPDEQWAVAKALFRVLRRALAELQLVFAQRGECDFVEPALLARSALEREEGTDDLAAALGMKFQHLLVDEMQDTSTSQYRLIELLTRGWDGQSQTVFLVGDPKQSIYLFRQARVERFVRTMLTGELGELPVGLLRLTANFRSQSGLVSAFNGDFVEIFPRETGAANPEDVPYVEAVPVCAATAGARNLLWHGNPLPQDLSPDNASAAKRRRAKLDARTVRAIIEQWRAQPLHAGRTEPWKIAVLVRSRNLLGGIVAEFKKDNGAGAIPYRAVDIETLGERQEVLDLFALTRALLHPADRAAWLAVLRAPWCGLGLAELHILAGADDPVWARRSMEDVIAERGHLLSEESCERLTRVWSALRAAADKRSQLTAAQCVERAWRSLGGDTYLLPNEMANARRYLQLLDKMEAQTGAIDVALLQQQTHNLYAEVHAADGAVDLMTIHGAKGLEWDVVIVPGIEKPPQQNKRRLLTWEEFATDEEGTAHVILAPIAGKGEGSKALNKWLNSVHKTRETAEQKRLFYVACTRAKEELHLFAAPKTTKQGNISLPDGSLLKAAWPAAEKYFASPTVPRTAAPASDDELALALAAAVDDTAPKPILKRLPLSFDPRVRFIAQKPLPYGEAGAKAGGARFERPEGSFEARAFGNAVHAFLEMLADLASKGVPAESLLQQVASWGPRIAALLRADGVPPESLERRVSQVKSALIHTLQDAEGRWVLTARDEASSELALTAWHEDRTSVRLDRVYRAGAQPLADGREFVWIVDYKTTTHGHERIEKFLEDEKETYAEQMETYARMLRRSVQEEIRVALYYPMLPKLIWWKPTA